MTTAPTADVVRNFSCITTVATTTNNPMMMVSWTMFGKCSGNAFDAQRVDCDDDHQVDDRQGHAQLVHRQHGVAATSGTAPLAERGRDDGVDESQEERKPEAWRRTRRLTLAPG